MKKFILLLIYMYLTLSADSAKISYENYLNSYTYEERKEMKIGSVELVTMLKDKEVQLIDIRFKEEYEAWRMPYSINIPLNKLAKRLNEIDKSKLIVTACPHNDRAIIAYTFLKLKGYDVRYLKDGLLGPADYLRGDNAREFMQALKKQ